MVERSRLSERNESLFSFPSESDLDEVKVLMK